MTDLVRSAARVLDLLEHFAAVEQGQSLAAVANAFSMPKSSTLALLRTLDAHGYLIRDASGQYRLNEAVRDRGLGWNGSQLLRLIKFAQPKIKALADEIGETVGMGALTADGHVCLMLQVLSSQPVRYEAELGGKFPVHCTAMGRVLLSQAPRDVLDELLRRQPLKAFTGATLTQVDDVMERIEAARKEGYSVLAEEFDTGGTGIAAPIRDPRGGMLAAINVSCVSARFYSKEDFIKTRLLAVAHELEAALVSQLAPTKPR